VRKFARLAVPAVVGSIAIFVGVTPAHASINSDCSSGRNQCQVSETMGSGYCNAVIYQTDSSGDEDYTGEFAQAYFTNDDTGYTCDFWVDRDVNDTGWYQISPTYAISSSGASVTSANYWNDGYDGYMAEVCFQFDWGSSLGAVHCSPYVTYG
jgi:hypothetical protein